MNITITGGTGFIGSRLAIKSVSMGHSVTVFSQANTQAEKDNLKVLESHDINIVIGNITDPETALQAVNGKDIVFHLAAAQHEANVPDEHFRNVNIEGTRNIIRACIDAGVKRLVHGSTIGVYGAALDGEINEDSPQRPSNIYGVTKAAAEKLVMENADKLPVSIIRISETYGPGDRRLLKLFRAIGKKMFFMIGDGKNKHQLIYVDDLIDGMYLAAQSENAVGEIFVLAGEEILTTSQMTETIAETLGTPIRRFRAPLWIFMTMAVILETLFKPFGIQPPLHRRRMDFFRKSFYFSRDKAVRLLDFHPGTSFRDGTRLTAEWYRENNLL